MGNRSITEYADSAVQRGENQTAKIIPYKMSSAAVAIFRHRFPQCFRNLSDMYQLTAPKLNPIIEKIIPADKIP